MKAEGIIFELNRLQSSGFDVFGNPSYLFEVINSNNEFYNDPAIQDAVIFFIVRVSHNSTRYIERAPNLVNNPKFHERLAQQIESPSRIIMNQEYNLLNAVFETESFCNSARIQQAIANMIRETSADIWNKSSMSSALVRILIKDSIRENPEIIKAFAYQFSKMNDRYSLAGEFMRYPQAAQIFKYPSVVNACKKAICDAKQFNEFPSFPHSIFNSPEFIPTFVSKLETLEDPIELIGYVWGCDKLREDSAIREAISNNIERVAKILRESKTLLKVKPICGVSIIIDNNSIRDALVSNIRIFIGEILLEGIPRDIEQELPGRVQDTLRLHVPFLMDTKEFLKEYQSNSRFQLIIDRLSPSFALKHSD